MKKCKIIDKSDVGIAIILNWVAINHRAGSMQQVPFVANVVKEAFLINVAVDSIITYLLNKANLIDV